MRKELAGKSSDEEKRRALLGLHRQLGDLAAELEHRSAARDHYQEAIELARGIKDMAQLTELEKAREMNQGADERFISNSIDMDFVLIRPGTYQRGGEQEPKEIAKEFSERSDLWVPELPRHEVRLTKKFYLGATEVTRRQFRAFVTATGYRTDPEKTGKAIGDFNPNTGSKGRAMANWKAEGNTYLNDDHPVS